MPGFTICDVCEEKTWEHLHFIAKHWDDLGTMLTRPESRANDGMPRRPDSEETGIELNERVMETRKKIVQWLHYWVRVVLDDNPGFTGPPDNPIAQARYLARQTRRITRGHDAQLAESFATEARTVRLELARGAFPSGARWFVPEPLIGCTESVEQEDGTTIPCPGHYRARLDSVGDGLPDLTCSEDKAHILTPAGFRRAGRTVMRESAATRLRDAIA